MDSYKLLTEQVRFFVTRHFNLFKMSGLET